MTMTGDWRNNPAEISRRVYASEAYKTYARLLTLDTNFFVFDRNYRDLKLAIHTFSQPERIPLLFDKRESQIMLCHMVRLVHNYLAAAKTLVDHTRTLVNDWYKRTDFLVEYKEQVKARFADNLLPGFIEDLRNYALHYSLPITGLRLHVTTDPETKTQTERVTFYIERATLLRWSNWSKGREFLQKADKEIGIEQLSDEYFQLVLSFHSWMHQRLEEIHAADLHWLNEMDKRVQDLLEPLRSEGAPTT
jgi:hypothetical protein